MHFGSEHGHDPWGRVSLTCKGKRSPDIADTKVKGELMLTYFDSVYPLLGKLVSRFEPPRSPGGRAEGTEGIPLLQCCEIGEVRLGSGLESHLTGTS